ncbi:MAG: hypothetical protein N3A65_10210, partial [candidate division WOR-3 bacterium]|nr:hypothetical protein [candidate division WOR-3 bacterium]
MRYILTILLFISGLLAQNLLVNGDFEQPLSNGWLIDTSTTNLIINRATNYDPDPDYEALVQKATGTGYAKLYQRVDIPSVQLAFSCNAKLIATTTS